MRSNKYKTNIIFLLISIIHFIITSFTDKIMFNFEEINIINYAICKIILFIVLVSFWQFIAQIIIYKNAKLKKYFTNFLIYIVPMIVLLLFIWPGIWLGDDNKNFFNYAITTNYFYQLNYLTTIFYIIAFMIFPCPSGAIILQTIFFGIVASYITTNTLEVTKNSKISYLMYLPFIFLHTIFYTFYVNRPVIVGTLYLLLVCILVFDKIKEKKLSTSKFWSIVLIVALLTTWRKEQFYLVLIIPILIFVTYKLKPNFKNIVKIIIPIFMITILIYAPQQMAFKDKKDSFKRNMPTYITPLSYMLNTDLRGENIEEALSKIDKIIDVSVCKKYPSNGDCAPLYHKEVWREFGVEDIKEFKKGYKYIVLHNLDKYIYSKLLTFLGATSIKGDTFSSIELYQNNEDTIYSTGIKSSKVIFDYNLRKNILTVIEGKTNNMVFNIIYRILFNLFIPIIAILIVFAVSVFKKNLFYFLITGMTLAQALIVFLTAPASYFMYYFYAYLLGWFLITFKICKTRSGFLYS